MKEELEYRFFFSGELELFTSGGYLIIPWKA